MTRLVEGRVIDSAGQPVPGAMVMVASGTAPTPEIAQRSDGDGRFRVALPDGSFRLEAHHPSLGKASCEITPATLQSEVELAFAAPG